MSFYVRLINIDNWVDVHNKNNLKGEAVTIDWNCRDNEWSVFKYENLVSERTRNDLLNKIVLRMVANNISKTCTGVTLLVLDNVFLGKINREIIEDEEEMGCRHCNIKGITFKDINYAVDYTLKNKSKFIQYSIKDIRNIFLGSTSDYLKTYKNYTPEKTLKKIVNCFLQDKKDFFQ